MIKIKMGQRIRQLRESNRLTRDTFAERVQISSKFLYEIEKGKKSFSTETLFRIADELNVSTDFICYGYAKGMRCMKCDEEMMAIIASLSPAQMRFLKDIVILIDKSVN